LGARFYWPEVGRFVHRDPIRDGINWYVYTANRPTVCLDPWGLKTGKDCAADYRKALRRCGEDVADSPVLGAIGGAIGGAITGAVGGAKGGGAAGAAAGTAVCPGAGTAGGALVGGLVGARTGLIIGGIAGGASGYGIGLYERKKCEERAEEDLWDCLECVRGQRSGNRQ
jgi:hypothetical protein